MYNRLYEKLSNYDLIIFDMDGTLYFQKGMQVRMALALLAHAFSSAHGIRDIRIISDFRQLREHWDRTQSIDHTQLFQQLSKKYSVPAKEIESLIMEWMFHKPMTAVMQCADQQLIETIKKLIQDGKAVCIYSDYATKEKCEALGITEIPQYYCGMPGISVMKPNPDGLNYVIDRYPDVARDKIIILGDRDDRDGEAGRGCGIDYLIFKRFKLMRMNQAG